MRYAHIVIIIIAILLSRSDVGLPFSAAVVAGPPPQPPRHVVLVEPRRKLCCSTFRTNCDYNTYLYVGKHITINNKTLTYSDVASVDLLQGCADAGKPQCMILY